MGYPEEINHASPTTAPRICPEDVEAAIAEEHYFTAAQGVSGARHVIHDENTTGPLSRITVCVLVLNNGFTVVGVNEGPVSADNFNAKLGCEYARRKALEQVWAVLGYQLKEQLHRAGAPAVSGGQQLGNRRQYQLHDVWRLQVHREAGSDMLAVVLKMHDGAMRTVRVSQECLNELGVRSELELCEYALTQLNASPLAQQTQPTADA